MTGLRAAIVGAYRSLLFLCPNELRADFGEEMTLVFAEDLTDSWENGGPAAAFRVSFLAMAELLRLGAIEALSIHGVLTSLIACAITAICFSAELAIARAQGPARMSAAPASAYVVMIVTPSLASALVAFIAARLALRNPPQRFID